MENVAYLRVSTESQTEKYGLEMQKQKILDYCKEKGVIIDKWYVDGGYSGAKLDRPQMQELLDDAEKGLFKTVYIYKLDRMSRDVIDTLDLLYRVLPEYNIKVVSMTEEIKTDNPMDKVMVTMNAAMNQYEREVIRMRMSAGMLERIKKGLWWGGGNKPYGYYYDRNDGILHPNDKADVIPQIFQLYLKGMSCENISKITGVAKDTIRNILTHKVYIGMIEYRGETYKGKHKPLIDEDTFYKAQNMMKKRGNNSYVANKYMLTGLLYCGVCGARMRYHLWGGKPKLICYSQLKSKEYMVRDANCKNEKVFASEVERLYTNTLKNFLINVDNKKKEEISQVALIEDAIEKSNKKIRKLYNVYAESDSEQLLEVIKTEEDHVKSLKEELKKEQSKKGEILPIKEIKKMGDIFDTLSPKEQNKIAKKITDKIIITNDKVEIFFKI